MEFLCGGDLNYHINYKGKFNESQVKFLIFKILYL